MADGGRAGGRRWQHPGIAALAERLTVQTERLRDSLKFRSSESAFQ